MLLKDIEREIKTKLGADHIKTHLRVNGVDSGITGFYNLDDLMVKYANNEAEIVTYEKDYGDNNIVLRSFLAINI